MNLFFLKNLNSKRNPETVTSIGFGLILILNLNGCAHLLNKSKDQEKAQIYIQLAADEFAQKEYGKATDSIHQALKFNPDFPSAYNHLGIIYIETKRFTKSEEACYFFKTVQNTFVGVVRVRGSGRVRVRVRVLVFGLG